jgi:hypothetical protein
MNSKILLLGVVLFVSAILCSCGGSKPVSATKSEQKKDSVALVKTALPKFKYRFYLGSPASAIRPHDEIWIDTNGQMTFDTQQKLKNGTWKSPRGLAYLEPKDADTLVNFLKYDQFFSIEESDVSPQCADGDQITLTIYRTDLKKELHITTNSCAAEFNLLTGDMRKLYPYFITFIGRLRDRYRPLFTE